MKYQPPISDDDAPEGEEPSALRGLLIALPVAAGLWIAVAQIARFFL